MSKNTANDYIVSTALDTANAALANALGDYRVKYWHGETIALVAEYLRVTAHTGAPKYGGTMRASDFRRGDLISSPYELASNIRRLARYTANRAPVPATALVS